MAIDLINIDNLVLADDFETWFQRTNEVIDALNPLQIYDLDDTGANIQNPLFAAGFVPAGFSLGLQFYRDIRFDGDMLIEVNAEPPLGFDAVTGALELSFTGPFAPPLLTGTPCGGVNAVANDDLYIVHDASTNTTKVVAAENQLSPRILCDHTFGDGVTAVTITIEGDLIVNGTQTILNTTTVEATDPIIDLNSDGTGTGTPAGNDALLGAGGIRILSTDGNKNFLWEVADNRWHISSTDSGDRGFQIDGTLSLFTRTIEPLTNNLDFIGSGTPTALSLHFHDANEATDEHWRLTLQDTFASGVQQSYTPTFVGNPLVYPGDPFNDPNPTSVNFGGTIRLEHKNSGSEASPNFDLQILFDSVTVTYDNIITGFARNLNADLLDGAHASVTPAPFTIPIADATGQVDPGWLPFVDDLVKVVNQTAHGFVFGDVVRIDKITPFEYILAQADTLDNAEAVGIVSKVVDANNFHLNMRGCINGTPTQWTNSSLGGPITPGGVYFLDKTVAGGMTLSDPTPGDISKTMMIGVTATQAIVMNYVGGLTDPTTGTPTIQLTNDVLAIGLLGSPLTTSIVERTSRQNAVGGTLPLVVQDNDSGSGNRTFEITMTADTTLELQQPAASAVDPVTNSVTLIIHQDGTGGWVPSITISGGGTIAWDNSASQPVVQTIALKTTIYVLLNVNDVSGVWYGSRAVFEV